MPDTDLGLVFMQKYICQPSEESPLFPYCVAVWNPSKDCYVPLEGLFFKTEEDAKQRAMELNQEYIKECNEN